jgi:hypothetical protein
MPDLSITRVALTRSCCDASREYLSVSLEALFSLPSCSGSTPFLPMHQAKIVSSKLRTQRLNVLVPCGVVSIAPQCPVASISKSYHQAGCPCPHE